MARSISLSDLNPPQRDAAATLRGPMLVLAGAGTGKTRVVTYRIANLIGHGVKSDRILAVTFTNKAANEMKERVTALLGAKSTRTRTKKPSSVAEPQVSTFHSLCVRILRRNIDKLGYPLEFSICDRRDQESFARQALREIKVSEKMLRPGDLLYQIGKWKSSAVRPREAASHAKDDVEHIAAVGYRRYQDALKTAGAVDFDDLLLCTEDLFRSSESTRRQEAALFDHILIDEYQDTNRSQYRIVRALAQQHRNLCVVGDDDQSIYGWRGAEVQHILRFQQDWSDAKVVRLEDNYRSTAAILELANTLIAFNKVRHGKVLKAARLNGEKPRVLQFKTETDEAEQVVLEIKRSIDNKKYEPSEIAILFRTNEQPRLFESELRRHKIPYVLIGGMSFFDRREIRDVVSYLQLIVRPDDDPALRRIINMPPRGISQQAVQCIVETATQRSTTPWKVMAQAQAVPGLSANAKQGCAQLRGIVAKYQQAFQQTNSLATTLRHLLEELRYMDELARSCNTPEEATAREEAIEQIVNALDEYQTKSKKPTLRGFLDEIILSNRELESDKDKQLQKNSIVLMTLHSAKGLEFPRVYMVGMEEGILPHHRAVAEEGQAIEEERRLCYVGVTRAEDELTLSLALTRRKWGQPRPTDASRFLFEMTGQAERFVPNRASKASPKRRLADARKKAARKKAGGNKPAGRKTGGKKAGGKKRAGKRSS